MFILFSHFSFPSEHSGSDFSLEENGTSSNQADDDEYLTTQVAYETEVASNEETTPPAESKDVEMVDVAKPEAAVESVEAASTVTSSPTSSTLRSSDEDAIVPMVSKARRTTGKLTRNHDDFPANSSRRYQQAEEENNDSNA
jgi:hypothetical protein